MPIDQWNYLPSVLYDKGVVVVVITTNVVSSYQPAHGEMYLIQHYVIKCVSDLRQVDGFLRVLPISPNNKTDRQDITEILLKVA